MPTPILMPKLGDIMTEGTVARWLVAPGSAVEKGKPLMEVATDKINFEVPAIESGILHAVLAEGQVAPVGGLVGYLLAPGEAPPAPSPQPSPTRGEGGAVSTRGSTSSPRTGEISVRPEPVEGRAATPGEPVRATPASRRLAKDLGVDIERVAGTGPGGRVSEEDVRNAKAAPPLQPSPSKGEGVVVPSPAGRGQGEGREPPFTAVPLAGIRKLIAQRMHQSLQATAQLSFALEVDVTDLVAARRQYLREHRGPQAARISYTELIIKAAAEALKRNPRLNAAIVRDELHTYQQLNIGFAVALDEGLLVPVVRDAGPKSVEDIARQVEDLLARAKAGKLTPDDLTGGTFTVSVLGSVDSFTPILNPPEVALLGVGRFVEKPAVYKGEIAKRTLVTLSLTVDHRAIDGAPAASFLRRLGQLLGSPGALFGAAEAPEEATPEE
ncbi:MAG: 2-oxo acid dehydrogenase subunit E2 [Dehalococcoidia bacterium]|nr:2-oxo acid dehydrogenase subunit E2 [Dehalococcoidia bacterium]